MLYDEVCLAIRKRIGEKKIDVIALRGTLGVRCPTLKMLCGALTSILVFFPVYFLDQYQYLGNCPPTPTPPLTQLLGFTRATDFAEKEGLLVVE